MNKTAFRSSTDSLSATLLHLGFLFSAPVFKVLLSHSHSQRGHFCLIPHDAHVQQHKEEIIVREERTTEGGNYRTPRLIHTAYLKYSFRSFQLLVSSFKQSASQHSAACKLQYKQIQEFQLLHHYQSKVISGNMQKL